MHTGVTMPKATVNENHFSKLWEANIGTTGQVFPMHPEPKTHLVQK
jgi:hypothetical protein